MSQLRLTTNSNKINFSQITLNIQLQTYWILSQVWQSNGDLYTSLEFNGICPQTEIMLNFGKAETGENIPDDRD